MQIYALSHLVRRPLSHPWAATDLQRPNRVVGEVYLEVLALVKS